MEVSRYQGDQVMDFLLLPKVLLANEPFFDGSIHSLQDLVVRIASIVASSFISGYFFFYPTIFCDLVVLTGADFLIDFWAAPWKLVDSEDEYASVKKAAITALSITVVACVTLLLPVSTGYYLTIAKYVVIQSAVVSYLIYFSREVINAGSYYSSSFAGLFHNSFQGMDEPLAYTVERGSIRRFPQRVLIEYATMLQSCLDSGIRIEKVNPRIQYLGELGQDQGGVSRDFYALLFSELLRDRGILDEEQGDLRDLGNYAFNCSLFYERIGLVMIHAGVKEGLAIGNCLDEAFFKAMNAFLSEDHHGYFTNEIAEDEKRKIEYKVAIELLPLFSSSERANYKQQLDFLLAKAPVTEEIAAYAVNTAEFCDLDDPPDEDDVQESPEKYEALIRRCITANFGITMQSKVGKFLSIMRGMDRGIRGFSRFRRHLERMSAIDFEAHIQGLVDREIILNALVKSPFSSGDLTEFNRKYDLLKLWIKDVATTDELKLFLSYTTGSTALTPTTTIDIGVNWNTGQFAIGETCYNRGTLSGYRGGKGVDDTVEEFGRSLCATMGNASEGFTMQ